MGGAMSAGKGPGGEPGAPSDLVVVYRWCNGSLPPPFHYEYVIRLGPGDQGSIDFIPDYPMHDPPVWTEAFDLAGSFLGGLYGLMDRKGILVKRWKEGGHSRLGGELEWMEVTVGERRILVPSGIEEHEPVKDVYEMIRGAVPQDIWDEMRKRQEGFQQRYSQGPGRQER
jgi:hypothetical protein